MDVRDAIARRMTCRAFLDAPVPRAVIEDILRSASRAPSSGNLQPWRVWAVAGADLDALTAEIASRMRGGEIAETPAEHLIYPPTQKEPYTTRRFLSGEAMYEALGVARDDWPGRMRQMHDNFDFFGASTGLFFAIDRIMQPGQWAELGMFMQNVMLLACEHGLDTAPIGAWSLWHRTVRRMLGIPEELILYCGMAIGRRNPAAPVNALHTPRASLEEFAVFKGF